MMTSPVDELLDELVSARLAGIKPLTLREAYPTSPRPRYFVERLAQALELIDNLPPDILAGMLHRQLNIPRWFFRYITRGGISEISGASALKLQAAYCLLSEAFLTFRSEYFPPLSIKITDVDLGNGDVGIIETAGKAVLADDMPIPYYPGYLIGRVMKRGSESTIWPISVVKGHRTIVCACPRCQHVAMQWPSSRCLALYRASKVVELRHQLFSDAMRDLFTKWEQRSV
ncbi:hypothetical protein HGA91_02530 [candidate division WWE3 bacterium]|nr:hypothetical protein [candidate division WWE3 bacterium]